MSGGDLLRHHLEWVEQDKLEVSEKFFSRNVEEKVAYESFMSDYAFKFKSVFEAHGRSKIDDDNLPCVIISSIVSVEDLEDGERMDFKIVSPSAADSEGDAIPASYLSPMGKAMLLKSKDDTITIKTPSGVFEYRIQSIKLT